MASQSGPNLDPVYFGGIEVDISQFDFSDHSSRLGAVTITCTVFIALVVLTVALRIFSRGRYVRHIFLDDVLIIFAAVFTVALAGMCIAATHHGLGRHIWLLPIPTLFDTLKNCILYLFVCQVLYCFAIALTKLAIISQYLRFIPDKSFRAALYAISVIILGLFITGIFVTIFQCRPVRGAWNFTIEPVCVDYVSYLYASSAVNVATDLLLFVLPLSHLWKLNLPRKQRVILCVLLAGGASACIVGIVRIAYLHQLRVLDITYQSVVCLILTVGECSLGIIFVSIAALRPMARQFFPKAMRNSPSSSAQPRAWPIRLQHIPASQDKDQYTSESKQNLSGSYGTRSGVSC
ncbi:unnamed protein product [Alternaria burnsii]|nr:unnamed protein product [Alternaria burnsii]